MSDNADRLAPAAGVAGQAGPGEIAPGVKLDDFLPYLLNRISSRLNRNLSGDLKTIDRSIQAYRVLATLTARDGRSINELSVYSMTEQSTLSKIIERLEKASLVARKPSPEDGRVVLVCLTREGRRAYEEIWPYALKHYRQALAGLSEKEHETLIDLLHRVLNNVRATEFP